MTIEELEILLETLYDRLELLNFNNSNNNKIKAVDYSREKIRSSYLYEFNTNILDEIMLTEKLIKEIKKIKEIKEIEVKDE